MPFILTIDFLLEDSHNPKCNYCNADTQNLMHLIWYCPRVTLLWNQIKSFIGNNVEVDVYILEWNLKTIFINKVHPKTQHIVNLCVLVTKHHIHAQKCLNKNLSTDEIIRQLNCIMKYEKLYTISEQQYKKTVEKWNVIKFNYIT